MAEPTKTTAFTTPDPRPETPMDKTTRAAMEIIDGQTKQRHVKTARLRKARLERADRAPIKTAAPKSKRARAKHGPKPSPEAVTRPIRDASVV